MAERIDHVAEARRLIDAVKQTVESIKGEFYPPEQLAVISAALDRNVAVAAVEAQLALVEQQRIANLIALASMPNLNGFENEVYDARLEALMAGILDRRDVPAIPGYGTGGIDEQVFIRPDIAAALGIGDDE